MSTTPTPQPGILDKLLMVIQLATVAAEGVPAASPFAAIALQFENIAKTAIAAHEQISGQPFDATKLQPIQPV